MTQPSPNHFESSGNSPTRDERISRTFQRVLRQTRRRQELLAPIAAAVQDALPVVFENTGGPAAMPAVLCRECNVRGQLSPFSVDGFEAFAHEPDCSAGKALKRAARISTYPEPTQAQLDSCLGLIKHSMKRILLRLAEEQGLVVEGGAR